MPAGGLGILFFRMPLGLIRPFLYKVGKKEKTEKLSVFCKKIPIFVANYRGVGHPIAGDACDNCMYYFDN